MVNRVALDAVEAFVKPALELLVAADEPWVKFLQTRTVVVAVCVDVAGLQAKSNAQHHTALFVAHLLLLEINPRAQERERVRLLVVLFPFVSLREGAKVPLYVVKLAEQGSPWDLFVEPVSVVADFVSK